MRKRFPRPVTGQERQDPPIRFINVPLALIELVIKERMFGPFRLLMYLKTQSIGGQLRPSPALFAKAAADLHLHPKSISRHFQALRKRNWIGQFNNGGLILRSFNNLQRIEKIKSRSAVIFDSTKHLDDKNTKAFIVAAVLGKLILNQKTRWWVAKKQGEKNGTPNERYKKVIPTSFPISCAVLSKIYGVSISTGSEWKQIAHKAGFVRITPTLRPMGKIDNVKEWQRCYPDICHRLRTVAGSHFIQYPDRVECNLSFCRIRQPHFHGQKSKHPNRQERGKKLFFIK